jgi:iron complex transport system ATP-binding protein
MQSNPPSAKTTRSDGPSAVINGSLIQTRNLSFAYSSLPAVVDVSLALPRGAMGALIGANGSGKSTLIRLLAGLLEPAKGDVAFNGSPLANLHPRDRAKRIAYVPQSTSTVFPFTALEVVLTGRSPYSGRFRFESVHDEQIALAALAALDAAHLSARRVVSVNWLP